MGGNPNPNRSGLQPAYEAGYSRPAEYTPAEYAERMTDAVANYGYSVLKTESREELTARLTESTAAFQGLCKFIYMTVFKPTDRSRKWNSNIDYNDVDLLYYLWDRYVLLCSEYGHNPTIQRFSIMTGITIDTFNQWKNNHYRRGKSENNSSSHSEFVRNALRDTEAALHDRTAEKNSIGSMFLLKALYGYRENSPVQYDSPEERPELTPAEIARKYGNIAELPPPPEDL